MKRELALLALLATGLLGAPRASAQINLNSGSKSFVYHYTNANGNSDYYSYAPSVVIDNGTEYIYTCHNAQPDQFNDNIWLTEINLGTGQIVYDQSVLQPTAGSWDSVDVCDPSVLRANATLGGVSYSYVLFYLGTDQSNNTHNQIGIAYANAPEGPWTKFTGHVVGYDSAGSSCGGGPGTYNCWGVGQPTATSVDGNGRVLLFWSGSAGANRGDINIGSLTDTGQWPVWNSSIAVASSGLTDSAGNSDWLNNYDVAYDSSRDRFYAVREQHDNSIGYCSPANPTYICQSLQLVSIDGGSVWNGGGTWSVEAAINPALTNYPRNHNAGLARDWYGNLLSSSSLQVFYTVSCADSTNVPCNGGTPEWTYSLWQIQGTIQ